MIHPQIYQVEIAEHSISQANVKIILIIYFTPCHKIINILHYLEQNNIFINNMTQWTFRTCTRSFQVFILRSTDFMVTITWTWLQIISALAYRQENSQSTSAYIYRCKISLDAGPTFTLNVFNQMNACTRISTQKLFPF